MRVTVLTYVEQEGSKSYDAVVPQVAAALRENGHSVSILGVYGDLGRLIGGIARRKPDVIFNLMEMFGKNVSGDVAITGLLELIGIPFTGCGGGASYLSQDKAIGKKLLAFSGIPYPRFAVFGRDSAWETGGILSMPMFVKPLRLDASIGIDAHGLVHDTAGLMERVQHIHAACNDDALAEEYIPGREFYVGVLGNAPPVALPPIEVDFTGMPAGMPHVMDRRAKFVRSSAEYKGTRSVLAELDPELMARLQKVSVEAYRALQARDYARVDLRMADTGEIYVLEVNASCYLERSGEFPTAAAAAGIEYPALVQRIVESAFERRPSRKA